MKIVSKVILVNTFMRMTWKKAMNFKNKSSVKMLIGTEISS